MKNRQRRSRQTVPKPPHERTKKDAAVRGAQLQDDEASAMERKRSAKLRGRPSGDRVLFDENRTAK